MLDVKALVKDLNLRQKAANLSDRIQARWNNEPIPEPVKQSSDSYTQANSAKATSDTQGATWQNAGATTIIADNLEEGLILQENKNLEKPIPEGQEDSAVVAEDLLIDGKVLRYVNNGSQTETPINPTFDLRDGTYPGLKRTAEHQIDLKDSRTGEVEESIDITGLIDATAIEQLNDLKPGELPAHHGFIKAEDGSYREFGASGKHIYMNPVEQGGFSLVDPSIESVKPIDPSLVSIERY